MSELRSGKWVCEQKGIPTEKLVAACHSGKITAYLPERGQKILSSSQCRKKFLFTDTLYFSLLKGSSPSYIGFNKGDLNNFTIHLGKIRLYSSENSNNNQSDTCSPNLEVVENKSLPIKGYHVLHELQYNDEYYLFFSKRISDLSTLGDVYKHINCLYPAGEIIFEPHKEGEYTLRFLELDAHHQSPYISKVDFSIKKVKYEDDDKLILEDNKDDNYISLYNNGLRCIDCTASPLRNKNEDRHFFSKPYQKCGKYFHQYKLNYFNPDDKEFKNPLQLKKDFFIFDYQEYCQQTYLQENAESRSDFYGYIESLFFDINELENIFIDDFEDNEMLEDPLGYMKLKCISLLKKYKGFNEEMIINAYFATLSTDITYAQLNDIFFPREKDHDPNVKTSRFSRHIDKFNRIADENDFPYIKADQLRNLTSLKVLEEVKKSIREQLATIRTKKREQSKP